MTDDLEYLFDYIEPTILITDKEFEEEMDLVCYEGLRKKIVFGVDAEEILLKPQHIKQFVLPKSFEKSPDELVACMILTSGTTGKPKVSLISHSMLINCINALKFSKFNSPRDKLVGTSGIRWISHINRMLAAIFYQSPQIFTGKDPDACNIAEIIEKFKGTTLIAPNSFLQFLFDYLKKNQGHDLSSLMAILNGGETPMTSVNQRWEQQFPGLVALNGYGMTEIGGLIAVNGSETLGINGGEIHGGFQVRVVGEDGETLLGPEECGIVHIKLRVPYLKYHKRPDDNRESFTPDGWFVTGDYGKMTKENYLHILCRFKDIPKCKGKMLIPNSLEEHINQHPLVNLGVVVGVGEKIVIFVKLFDGNVGKMVKTELEGFMKSFVDWEVVESVVFLEKFKIISTGKVDKIGLKRAYLEGEYNNE